MAQSSRRRMEMQWSSPVAGRQRCSSAVQSQGDGDAVAHSSRGQEGSNKKRTCSLPPELLRTKNTVSFRKCSLVPTRPAHYSAVFSSPLSPPPHSFTGRKVAAVLTETYKT